MSKKMMLAALIVVILAAILMVSELFKSNENPAEQQVDVATETQQPEETNLPGLEDSIFDDEEEEIAETGAVAVTESEEPTTEAEATQPTSAGSGDAETTEPTGTTSVEPVTGNTAFERYEAMSADEQRAYMMSFENMEDFFDWYNKAKAEYDALHPDIEISDGKVDIGQLP